MKKGLKKMLQPESLRTPRKPALSRALGSRDLIQGFISTSAHRQRDRRGYTCRRNYIPFRSGCVQALGTHRRRMDCEWTTSSRVLSSLIIARRNTRRVGPCTRHFCHGTFWIFGLFIKRRIVSPFDPHREMVSVCQREKTTTPLNGFSHFRSKFRLLTGNDVIGEKASLPIFEWTFLTECDGTGGVFQALLVSKLLLLTGSDVIGENVTADRKKKFFKPNVELSFFSAMVKPHVDDRKSFKVSVTVSSSEFSPYILGYFSVRAGRTETLQTLAYISLPLTLFCPSPFIFISLLSSNPRCLLPMQIPRRSTAYCIKAISYAASLRSATPSGLGCGLPFMIYSNFPSTLHRCQERSSERGQLFYSYFLRSIYTHGLTHTERRNSCVFSIYLLRAGIVAREPRRSGE